MISLSWYYVIPITCHVNILCIVTLTDIYIYIYTYMARVFEQNWICRGKYYGQMHGWYSSKMGGGFEQSHVKVQNELFIYK